MPKNPEKRHCLIYGWTTVCLKNLNTYPPETEAKKAKHSTVYFLPGGLISAKICTTPGQHRYSTVPLMPYLVGHELGSLGNEVHTLALGDLKDDPARPDDPFTLEGDSFLPFGDPKHLQQQRPQNPSNDA